MINDLPWPWPGDGPAPEPVKHWVIYDDGVTGQLTVTGDGPPVLSRPGRLVTQEEYEAHRAQMQAAHDERIAELQAAETAEALRQFQDLRAAGIPEATARQLSSYTGPAAPTGTQTRS
ncbi:hypothetical protein [Streptomyces sp. NPDC003393]